jgi:hypothetical protein
MFKFGFLFFVTVTSSFGQLDFVIDILCRQVPKKSTLLIIVFELSSKAKVFVGEKNTYNSG